MRVGFKFQRNICLVHFNSKKSNIPPNPGAPPPKSASRALAAAINSTNFSLVYSKLPVFSRMQIVYLFTASSSVF